MENTVVIIGAGDLTGKRIARDFLKRGWRVLAGCLPGQEESKLEGNISFFSADPMSHASMLEAARKLDQPVDMLVINVDYDFGKDCATILDPQNFAALMAGYEYNTVGPLRATNAFMPLLELGKGKRICVVTTKDSSNNLCRDIGGYGRHITKAPLNQAMNQLFNGLRPEGYTFRMYCKDPTAGEDMAGSFAAEYFIRNRSFEPEDYKHSDENRLVLRDWMSIELPW